MPHIQSRKLFLINRNTMKRHCIDGLTESTHKSNHKSLRKNFEHYIMYSPDDLPPKVDLRPWMTPVEDQLEMNSCTANALTSLYEYLIRKSTAHHIDLSRLFIYYNARKKDKEKDDLPPTLHDEGASIVSTIDTLKEKGACLERSWPYLKEIVNLKPSKNSKEEARNFTIIGAMEIPVDLHHMKSCLAQGFPFIFGLRLYESFDKAASNGGVVPLPKSSMAVRASHGNHALLAVGYSEASQAFIVRNSWGEGWGDKGYCYISYEYMTNKKLCSNLWTIKHTSANSLGTEHWNMQDTINHRAPYSALGPTAYTDDNDGLSIEQGIVSDTVCPSGYCNQVPDTNYAASSMNNYLISPLTNYVAPPMPMYIAPPVPNYFLPVAANYVAPPMTNYVVPSLANYGVPPIADYAMSPIMNYASAPIVNYVIPPVAIYGGAQSAPFGILPNLPSSIYRRRSIAPYGSQPFPSYNRRSSVPSRTEICRARSDRPRSLWRRIFLKP